MSVGNLLNQCILGMSEKKYIPGSGPLGAKLMILGDCPTSQDTIAGKLFTGSIGRELDYLLNDAGMHRSNCWVTSVSKYEVPPNLSGKHIPFAKRAELAEIDIQGQLNELREEINGTKPNCILGLGGPSLWALGAQPETKIGDYRGSILMGAGTKFVPTYNPAGLLFSTGTAEFKGYWNRQIMIFDFKRAKQQSEFKELIRPSRLVEICKNSAHLAQFRDRYLSKKRMSVDIEANGTCIPVCIGLAFNSHHGMTVPLWNCDGISTIPTADLIQCWLILAEMLYEKDIIGQNFNYDRDKIKRLGFIIRRLVSDTMLKAHAINPELPKGLAFNTSIYTEEPFYKNEGMYEGTIQDLLLGCARDACVTFEVDEKMNADLDELGMRSFYTNFLMKLPEFYWKIEQQGFRVDHEERDRLVKKYVVWDESIRYELFKLVGAEINVQSPKQVATLLFDNLGLPRRAGTGEEEITALLNSQNAVKDESHRRICELILEGRRVRKSISTYLMALPDYDRRMRTTYFPCLDTGRSSTGQQDPPIRPTVEVIDENGKKKNKPLGIPFQVMTKHGDIGADIRGMYVPDTSHIEYDENNQEIEVFEEEVFVQPDSSQAEARVIFNLAQDEEALKDIDEHDYHALTASWFFGGSEFDYSKKILGYEHPIRFAGKTLRHAGHLGAGKRRAATELNTQARKYKIPIKITEADAERSLKIFHGKQPRIQQVFQAQVIECIKRTRQLIAPLPYGVNAAMGGKRTFFERMGEELFRQALAYLPQRAVSDNTKAAGIRISEKCSKIRKNGRTTRVKIAMESHDALLFSIPVSWLPLWAPIIREEMERPIDFSRCSLPRHELSIPCDIEIGNNYRDFKKFKDIPIVAAPRKELPMVQRTMTERFTVVDLPEDTKLDNLIYNNEEWKHGQSN